jgi:hypothetical protein
MKKLIKGVVFAILLLIIVSCFNVCFHIPISALWSKFIDRKVNYVANTNTIIENEMVNIEHDINCSVNPIFTKAPKAIIYENYCDPFSLQMKIKLLDKDINKIVIKKCYINKKNGEIMNILEMPIENINISFSIWTNDRHSAWGRDYKQFDNSMNIILEKRENEYVDKIYINFNDIPIMYKLDINISIIYEIEIYKGNEKNIFNNEISYIRKIEELNMYSPIRNSKKEDNWHEISIEEWEKGLSFSVIKYYDD